MQNDLERMAEHGVTVDEAMLTVRYAIGGDNVVGIKQADSTVVPLGVQYSPEYIDTLEKVRTTPVVTGDGRAVPLGEIADVSVRKMPEMIRNDNGKLCRLHLRRSPERHATDYVDRAQRVLATNAEAAGRLLHRVDRAVPVHRGGARPAARRSCR